MMERSDGVITSRKEEQTARSSGESSCEGALGSATKQHEKPSRAAGLIAVAMLAIAVTLAVGGLAVWLTVGSKANNGTGKRMYDGYVYRQIEAGGIVMHAIVTNPARITLEANRGNVSVSPYYGVNGGFFYNGQLLSIAVVNDLPVGGKPGAYGSGDANARVPRGTLVWDAAAEKLSVQVVSHSSELAVSDRGNYWAQSGISMRPGDDAGWRKQAVDKELAPFPDDDRLRTAAVFDEKGKLYLVVTASETTLEAFRAALIESFDGLADGIFLDGDGSSQLRTFEADLRGDGRRVEQMLRLRKPDEAR